MHYNKLRVSQLNELYIKFCGKNYKLANFMSSFKDPKFYSQAQMFIKQVINF